MIVFFMALGTSGARAQSAGDRSRARALLSDGDRALARRDYNGALAKFQEAFAVVPSPKIQFNFGLAYRGLARHADAHAAFQAFLTGAKDAPADRLKEARALLKEEAAATGRLAVTCNVEGADVLVDERNVGKTPLAEVVLDPGPHEVVISRGEGALHRERIVLARGETTRLSTTLVVQEKTVQPPPTLAVIPPPPPVPAVQAAPAPASEPVYTRGWFWATVGVVVVAGAVATYLATRPSGGCDSTLPSCIRVP